MEAQNGSEEGSGTAAMVRSTPTNSAAVLNLASSSLRGPPRGVDARSDYVQFSGGCAHRTSRPTARAKSRTVGTTIPSWHSHHLDQYRQRDHPPALPGPLPVFPEGPVLSAVRARAAVLDDPDHARFELRRQGGVRPVSRTITREDQRRSHGRSTPPEPDAPRSARLPRRRLLPRSLRRLATPAACGGRPLTPAPDSLVTTGRRQRLGPPCGRLGSVITWSPNPVMPVSAVEASTV